jgi:hypothetical protein
MGMTLNSVAQGCIYRQERGAGTRSTSRWHALAHRIGLEDPVFPSQVVQHIGLSGQAIARPAAMDGRFNHLFDPRNGECNSTFLPTR